MILKRRGKSTSATIATENDTHRPSGQLFTAFWKNTVCYAKIQGLVEN